MTTKYLTAANHASPPSFIVSGGLRHPVQIRINRNTEADKVWLASHDIFPHVTEDGDPILGYSEWVFDEATQTYNRTLLGTPEERQAEIDARAASASEASRTQYLDSLECTRLQGKLALIDAGLFNAFETLVTQMLGSMTPEQRVFFEDAPVWKFRDPVLQMLAAALGITEEQTLVDLFELAKTK
jgi:hypothetical protein